MGLINKPYTFIALTTKSGEALQVNSNFDVLFGLANGNIEDPNISAVANIQQSKILNLVGDLNVIRNTRVNEVNVQLFTITVGVNTYTKPIDLLFADIIAIGGGGGGGSPALAGTGLRAGGGGGGGGFARSLLFTTAIGATEIVTVGGAGGGSTIGTAGNTGGATSFGALVTANGGAGGSGATGDSTVSQGGLGGGGTFGQILLGGNDAGHGFAQGLGAWCGGHGGSSMSGGGGAGAFAGVQPLVGRNFGGGGGGGLSDTNTNSLGAVGANGVVTVIEYKA